MRSVCGYFIGGPLDLTKSVLQSEHQVEVYVSEQLTFSREQVDHDFAAVIERAKPRHRYIRQPYALSITEPAGRRTFLYLYQGIAP